MEDIPELRLDVDLVVKYFQKARVLRQQTSTTTGSATAGIQTLTSYCTWFAFLSYDMLSIVCIERVTFPQKPSRSTRKFSPVLR